MNALFLDAIAGIEKLHTYCKKNRAHKKALIERLAQMRTYLRAALREDDKPPRLKNSTIVGLKLKDKFSAIENGFKGLNLGELKWQENFYKDALHWAKIEGKKEKIAFNSKALEQIAAQTQIVKTKLLQELKEAKNG